jgi:hypothetical protein
VVVARRSNSLAGSPPTIRAEIDTSGPGGVPTSRSTSPTAARCSPTRRATRRAGSSRRPGQGPRSVVPGLRAARQLHRHPPRCDRADVVAVIPRSSDGCASTRGSICTPRWCGDPMPCRCGRDRRRIAERRREVRTSNGAVPARRTVIVLVAEPGRAGLVCRRTQPAGRSRRGPGAGTERLTEARCVSRPVSSSGPRRCACGSARSRSGSRSSRWSPKPSAPGRPADGADRGPRSVSRPWWSPRAPARSCSSTVTGWSSSRTTSTTLPVIRLAGAPQLRARPSPTTLPWPTPTRAWRGLSGPLRAEVVLYDAGTGRAHARARLGGRGALRAGGARRREGTGARGGPRGRRRRPRSR